MTDATSRRRKRPRTFRNTSWILGICAFGLLLLSFLLSLLYYAVTPRSSFHDWLFTSISILRYAIWWLAILSAVLAIILSIVGKRRLASEAEKKDRRRLNIGLTLGIVYLSLIVALVTLVLVVRFAYPPWRIPKSEKEWKSTQLAENVRIEYRRVEIGSAGNINQVCMFSPDYGWLAGDYGFLSKYAQGKWNTV